MMDGETFHLHGASGCRMSDSRYRFLWGVQIEVPSAVAVSTKEWNFNLTILLSAFGSTSFKSTGGAQATTNTLEKLGARRCLSRFENLAIRHPKAHKTSHSLIS